MDKDKVPLAPMSVAGSRKTDPLSRKRDDPIEFRQTIDCPLQPAIFPDGLKEKLAGVTLTIHPVRNRSGRLSQPGSGRQSRNQVH